MIYVLFFSSILIWILLCFPLFGAFLLVNFNGGKKLNRGLLKRWKRVKEKRRYWMEKMWEFGRRIFFSGVSWIKWVTTYYSGKVKESIVLPRSSFFFIENDDLDYEQAYKFNTLLVLDFKLLLDNLIFRVMVWLMRMPNLTLIWYM